MAAVTFLTSKLLKRTPPSPTLPPAIIYVEGYGERPDEVSDPRKRSGLQEFIPAAVPADFYLHEEEPGLPKVPSESAQDEIVIMEEEIIDSPPSAGGAGQEEEHRDLPDPVPTAKQEKKVYRMKLILYCLKFHAKNIYILC